MLRTKWNLSLSANRLYEIFDEWRLSQQKAHRDYGPVRPAERAASLRELEKKPRPPAPALPSHEARRQKLNGFLAVNLNSGQTTVDFQPQAKTANAVYAIALIVLRYAAMGFHQIVFILDNCSLHNATMKTALTELLAEIALAQGIAVDFLHTPVYSPNFNPAEYLIRLVRKNSLYHLPCTMTIQERAERVQEHLAQAPPQTPEQIKHILRHIERLPTSGWS